MAPENATGQAVERVSGRELQAEVGDFEAGSRERHAAARWIIQKTFGLQLRHGMDTVDLQAQGGGNEQAEGIVSGN